MQAAAAQVPPEAEPAAMQTTLALRLFVHCIMRPFLARGCPTSDDAKPTLLAATKVWLSDCGHI